MSLVCTFMLLYCHMKWNKIQIVQLLFLLTPYKASPPINTSKLPLNLTLIPLWFHYHLYHHLALPIKKKMKWERLYHPKQKMSIFFVETILVLFWPWKYSNFSKTYERKKITCNEYRKSINNKYKYKYTTFSHTQLLKLEFWNLIKSDLDFRDSLRS